MPVFCKLRAIFPTFPFRDARFAVYQCSGVAAYFKEIRREGCRGFTKDRVGRQVGELVHRGKGALGAQSFALGQLVNPWRVWVRTRERTGAADVKAGVCYQITRSRRGRRSLPQAPCPKGSSAAGGPCGAELFSLPGGATQRSRSRAQIGTSHVFQSTLRAKRNLRVSRETRSASRRHLPRRCNRTWGRLSTRGVEDPRWSCHRKTWLWARAPSAPRLQPQALALESRRRPGRR